MPTGLTPEQRSLRARLAAHTLHATVDSAEHVAHATAASPARIDYWKRRADPDGVLTEVERRRRAEHLKKAYFQRLAMKSAKARRRKAAS